MRPTRRLWASLALCVVLAAVAIILAHPLALAGIPVIATWAISHQWAFLEECVAIDASLTVEESLETHAVAVDDTTEATITATIPRPTSLHVDIAPGFPVATRVSNATPLSIARDLTQVNRTVDITWPVAGRHRFDPATITATDGLLTQSFTAGSGTAVTVEPRSVDDIHVGAGGERHAVAYGDHQTDRTGPGTEPATVREYAPGDPANWIDWNASARLPEIHVREFQVESDHALHLVVDHRPSLAEGTDDRTKLDMLRLVALSLLHSARRSDDPVGLVTATDDTIATHIRPGADPNTFAAIRRRLLVMRADARDTSPTARGPISATKARQAVTALDDDDSAFARTLRPYFADSGAYHQRVADRPLYEAVDAALTPSGSRGLTVILTDDEHPGELTEAIGRARSAGQSVLVFLAPTVLFTPPMADPEAAYERYVAFEEYRRELAATPGVSALEVGPRDALAELLSIGRARRTPGGVTT